VTFRGERCTLTDGNPSLREGLLPQKRIVATSWQKGCFPTPTAKTRPAPTTTRGNDNALGLIANDTRQQRRKHERRKHERRKHERRKHERPEQECVRSQKRKIARSSVSA